MGKFLGWKGWVCGILALIALAVYYYLPATAYLLNARHWAKDNPDLWQIPRPLHLENHGPIRGNQISFRGVTFSASWGDAKLVREFKSGGLFTFGESRSVLFLSIAETPVNYRSPKIKDDNSGILKRLVGESAMRSNFDFEREVLNSNPRDLVFSFDRARMAHQAMFMLVKQIEADKGQTGIYEFRADHVRGFQKGNPEVTGSAILDVYDGSDRLTTIVLGQAKNALNPLTQAEVNAFIESLDIDASAGAQTGAGK